MGCASGGIRTPDPLFRRQMLYPTELLTQDFYYIIFRCSCSSFTPRHLYYNDHMAIHYYPLINKVITSLNLREKLAFAATDHEFSFPRPFITVAREPGSGGTPIAQALAERLGYKFINEEIIDEIASSTKRRKEVIKAIDERGRSSVQDMIHSILNTEYVDDVKYVTELAKIILTYAHQGNVVILGRGANFITPFSKGLHINVTAPYVVRVERSMQYEGYSQEEAKRVIANTEQERELFVKQYFKRDVRKRNSYDLTINTAYFDVKEAVDIAAEAFYQKFPRIKRYTALFTKPVPSKAK